MVVWISILWISILFNPIICKIRNFLSSILLIYFSLTFCVKMPTRWHQDKPDGIFLYQCLVANPELANKEFIWENHSLLEKYGNCPICGAVSRQKRTYKSTIGANVSYVYNVCILIILIHFYTVIMFCYCYKFRHFQKENFRANWNWN